MVHCLVEFENIGNKIRVCSRLGPSLTILCSCAVDLASLGGLIIIVIMSNEIIISSIITTDHLFPGPLAGSIMKKENRHLTKPNGHYLAAATDRINKTTT